MRNYNGLIYVLIILSLTATLLMWGNMVSIYTGVVFNLFTILGIVVLDFMKTRRITLFQIWGIAFVYIIWAEMMDMSVMSSASRYLNAIAFLLVSKSVLDMGYMTYHSKHYGSNLSEAWLLVKPKAFFAVMVTMLVIWLSSNYLTVLTTMTSGRQLSGVLGSSIDVWGVFISASSLIVPALAAYYYRWHSQSSILWSLIFLLPVAMFQIILGTRSRLIYMILPWLILTGIVGVKRQKMKALFWVMIGVVAMSMVSNFMKQFRNQAFLDFSGGMISTSKDEQKDPFLRLADKMSPEGCVYMTYLAEDWFSTHEHSYGREIGFMFYWVIPRAIWKDKPTPVDHWLIRKYENVEETYSSASGFTGEIRADFGYWCIIIVFFFGRILKKADLFVLKSFNDDGPYLDKILAASIYPCVFFFVRSPLTSTQYFFVEVLLYLAIRRWLGRKYKMKNTGNG